MGHSIAFHSEWVRWPCPACPCPSGARGWGHSTGASVLLGKTSASGGGHRGGHSQVSKAGDTVYNRQAQGAHGPTLGRALPTSHREITCKLPSLLPWVSGWARARNPHGVRPQLPGPQPLLLLGRRPSSGRAVHLRQVSPGPIPRSRPARTAGKSSNSPAARPSTLRHTVTQLHP